MLPSSIYVFVIEIEHLSPPSFPFSTLVVDSFSSSFSIFLPFLPFRLLLFSCIYHHLSLWPTVIPQGLSPLRLSQCASSFSVEFVFSYVKLVSIGSFSGSWSTSSIPRILRGTTYFVPPPPLLSPAPTACVLLPELAVRYHSLSCALHLAFLSLYMFFSLRASLSPPSFEESRVESRSLFRAPQTSRWYCGLLVYERPRRIVTPRIS